MKKILLLLLTLLLALSMVGFFACDSPDNSGSTGGNDQQQEQEQPSDNKDNGGNQNENETNNNQNNNGTNNENNNSSGSSNNENESGENTEDDSPYVPTEGLAYELSSDGTYYICTGMGTATETDIFIASKYNDLPVTSMGDYAFAWCKDLKSATLPNGVTSLGDFAFFHCESLENISIPNSIINIGEAALDYCDNLKVNEDDNALYLGNNENKYLVLIVVKDDSITKFEIKSNTKIIFALAFSYCDIKTITIPNSVVSIDSSAFWGCSYLTNITIPKSVTNIASSAFKDCSSLESITVENGNKVYHSKDNCLIETATNTLVTGCKNSIIPNYVTRIGDYAFEGCRSLENLIIPNSVTSIGHRTFKNCNKLKYNEYDNALYLGNNENKYLALINTKDNNIISCEINSKTKVIYESAFSGCRSLTSINIPNSVTSIGGDAFSAYSSLESITVESGNTLYHSKDNCLIETATNTLIRGCKNSVIPNYVTNIGADAFSGCSDLTSITIPNSVTSIGIQAFYGCSSIRSITIPNSVTSIGDYAFWFCYELTSITIPNSVTSIGSGAFCDCSSLQYNEYDNGLYLGNNENKYLWLIQAKDKNITSCEINANTKFIYDFAFSDCSSLTSITIPNSVKSIGHRAFCGCSSLTSITFKGTKEQWSNISKDSGWNYYTGNYTIHYTDGDITKA